MPFAAGLGCASRHLPCPGCLSTVVHLLLSRPKEYIIVQMPVTVQVPCASAAAGREASCLQVGMETGQAGLAGVSAPLGSDDIISKAVVSALVRSRRGCWPSSCSAPMASRWPSRTRISETLAGREEAPVPWSNCGICGEARLRDSHAGADVCEAVVWLDVIASPTERHVQVPPARILPWYGVAAWGVRRCCTCWSWYSFGSKQALWATWSGALPGGAPARRG